MLPRQFLACGPHSGPFGRLLRERGHSVIAIDGARATARMAHRGGGQRVLVADAAHLPLKSGRADLAVAFMSPQDVPELDRTIAEVSRVLVPAGRFCLAIAHPLRSAGGFTSKDRGSPFTLPSYEPYSNSPKVHFPVIISWHGLYYHSGQRALCQVPPQTDTAPQEI
ncbi:MAG TPA: class I SAM-dependent methyltransferase [Candidatus Binatia bacterium]|nr:class I SAM-dependent methyltransferase [Candidatus Binatia bacterium]